MARNGPEGSLHAASLLWRERAFNRMATPCPLASQPEESLV